MGTRADLDKLYRKHKDVHVNSFRKLMNCSYEQAEDLIQDSYVLALMYIESFDPSKSSLRTWFNSIAFNLLRKQYKDKKIVFEELKGDEYPDETLTPFEDRVDILHTIEDYTDNTKHSNILKLFFILGYTTKEISEVLDGVSQTNATTVCSRFRKDVIKSYADSF